MSSPVRSMLAAVAVLCVPMVSFGGPAWASPAPPGAVVDRVGDAAWANVDGGTDDSCGVRSDGTLWCWGYNGNGQLGTGDREPQPSPTQIGDETTWAEVNAGYTHTCAIKTDQTLWCWGDNQYGELGIGVRYGFYPAPTQVTSGGNGGWLSVSVGAMYTCAVDRTHRFWCWGHDLDGVLGDGQSESQLSPELIGTARVWGNVAASTSDLHTCATKLDGNLFCWGMNHFGQLGVGSTHRHMRPAHVGTDTDWATVSTGGYFTCATKTTGTLWCWGSVENGELGTGGDEDELTPTQITSATTWSAVSTGRDHACASRTDGSLWCWGLNTYGELGDGTKVSEPTPVQVGSSDAWVSPSVGDYHTCGRQSDNTLWCWGSNGSGQIGIGKFGGRVLGPTQVD
jgi:alpha-tubulin suppressor-like RCC1 family protein